MWGWSEIAGAASASRARSMDGLAQIASLTFWNRARQASCFGDVRVSLRTRRSTCRLGDPAFPESLGRRTKLIADEVLRAGRRPIAAGLHRPVSIDQGFVKNLGERIPFASLDPRQDEGKPRAEDGAGVHPSSRRVVRVDPRGIGPTAHGSEPGGHAADDPRRLDPQRPVQQSDQEARSAAAPARHR